MLQELRTFINQGHMVVVMTMSDMWKQMFNAKVKLSHAELEPYFTSSG